MKKRSLPIQLQPGEIRWGLRYLLFELVFLGNLLSMLLPLIRRGISSAELAAVYYAVNLIAVIWIFRQFFLSSLRYSLRHWGRALLTTLFALAVYLLLFRLLNRILPDFSNPNDTQIQGNFEENRFLTALGAILLVPLAEETLFRGLIFGILHGKSRILAYGISTIAFCMIHVSGYAHSSPPMFLLLSIIQYIPAGLTLAWAYEFSGSIYAPILMHTLINTIATLDLR